LDTISQPVDWPDDVDEVITGDLTAAAAYVTPAGGAVVTSVCPMGIDRREAGEVGFTTSLGFAKKLERIIADPHVALAYHARDHGFSASPAWPDPPAPQAPPRNGTGPRVDVDRAAVRIGSLPHRVLAYRGTDGFPVVVPVRLAGHDTAGLRLVAASGLLPPGGRRAGLLAHAYHPQLVGLATRTFTGWLQVAADGTAVYAPHTSKGFVAPPRKKLLLVSNGLFAKYGLWQARRQGTADRLEQLAMANGGQAADL